MRHNMNGKSLPIGMAGLLPHRYESTISLDAARTITDTAPAWDHRRSPALKPDEQALHDALLRIAHRAMKHSSPESPVPAEVFLG
jgi:hypothetical protein